MRTSKLLLRACSVSSFTLLLLAGGAPLHAQAVNDGNTTGLPPFGSFHGSGFDVVALQNGSLHIDIPFARVPRRGGSFTYRLVYDTPTWGLYTFKRTPTSSPEGMIVQPAETSGWRVPDPTNWGIRFTVIPENCTYQQGVNSDGSPAFVTGQYEVRSMWTAIDPEGTKHPFLLRYNSPPPSGSCQEGNPAPQRTGLALDGTGVLVDTSSNINFPKIVLKDGTQVQGWTDTNGNHPLLGVSTSGQIDSSGNPVFLDYYANDSNGNPQQYRVDYGPVTIQTSFCPLIPPVVVPGGCTEFSGTQYVPTKFTLPTGKFYQFTYAQNGNGDLLRVDLPTGGSISYTYKGQSYAIEGAQNGGGGGGCVLRSCGAPGTAVGGGTTRYIRRAITSRTLNVGGVPNTWTYGVDTSGNAVVTDPLGNDEVHVIVPVSVTAGMSLSSYDQEVRFYRGSSTSGTLLRTVTKDYAAEAGPIDFEGYNYGLINVRVIRETTTLDDGQVSKVETDYDTSSFTGAVANYTFTRLNVTERREYAFGAGAPGPLVRRTANTYLHTNNSTYQNLNIADRVASTIVYDGSGNIVAQTQDEYDNYTQPIQSTDAVQHDSNFNSSYLTRGTLTAVSRWRNTDGVFLTSRNQYDDVGNVVSTTDPLGNTTQFDYSDAFGNATCAPGSGSLRAFLKQSINALTQAVSFTHNSCTGTVASATDANSKTSTFSYDSMNRHTLTNFPDSGHTTNTYDDTQLIVTSGRELLAPSTFVYTRQHFDGLGRVFQSELCEDGTTTCAQSAKTDTTFDALSRPATVSNPHRAAPSSTDGITTFNYDVLNRVTKTIPPDGTTTTNNVVTGFSGNCTTLTDQLGKVRKSCSDSLGRLTQLFEPDASNNLVNETDYQYDALNNLICVVQKGTDTTAFTNCASAPAAWRPRSFAYNSLSQLLTATNPESGTITYTYDADGNLLTKTAPAPASGNSTPATISFVQVNSATPQSPTASVTVTYTAAQQAGDLNVVVVGWNDSTAAVSSVTDTSGNSYALAAGPTIQSGAATQSIYYAKNILAAAANANTVTVTFATAAAFPDIRILEYSGVDALSPVDVTSAAIGNSGTSDSGAATTNNANDLIFGANLVQTSTDATGSTFTERTITNPDGDIAEDMLVNTAGSYNATAGLSRAGWWIMQMVAFRAAQIQAGGSTVTTTYSYDNLNRLTQKSYSDGTTATVKYGYDGVAPTGCTPPTLTITNGIGRRTSMCDAAGSEAWSYDVMGRTLTGRRTTNAVTKSTSYTYNLNGSVATLTYPTGRVVTYSYNSAAQPTSAVDNVNSINFATNALYTPHGALDSMNNEPTVTSKYFYNNRLQTCRIAIMGDGHNTLPSSCTDMSQVSTITDLSYFYCWNNASPLNPCPSNNGNVAIIRNNTYSSWQLYSYDELNRLKTASEASTPNNLYPPWALSFGYDIWGNLLTQTVTSGSAPQLNVTVNTKNQIANSGFVYDAAGNLAADTLNTYTYDAENRIKSAQGITYTYDGDGKRVQKSSGKLYWYGMSSEAIARTDSAGNTPDDFIFFAGMRIAWLTASGSQLFFHADALGSVRKMSYGTGGTMDFYEYYPFGGAIRPPTTGTESPYKFTGKEHDNETGNDDFGARYYSSSLGRFGSPDPIMVLKQKLIDPQQWNMYSYARNNPLRFVDPSGKAIELTGNDEERKRQLEALQRAVGKKAGAYLYDNVDPKTGKHYVGIYSGGPDGKGPSFETLSASANKLNGIIQSSRVAELKFVPPGKEVEGYTIGSPDNRMQPGYTSANMAGGTIYLTSGDVGSLPGRLSSTYKPTRNSLADVLFHEIGHLDSIWFHWNLDADGDGVRMENEARKNQGEKATRTGHEKEADVELTGTPY